MSETDRDLEELVLKLGRALHVRGWRLGAAESCTGGWIAKVLTDVAGSSQWFDGGVVAYSNAAKTELLGVPTETLAVHGAVSEETARAMADGARRRFAVDLAVAVTGIAGPGGGSRTSPSAPCTSPGPRPDRVMAARRIFVGSRESVRRQTVALALERLVDLVWDDERQA